MTRTVTVAIPVRDGGAVLRSVLDAVARQQLDPGLRLEVLVCDSGSRDGSPEAARAAGAEVFEIAPETFSHGATRNLLMERAAGDHVAFLTQDARPAHARWLAELLSGFALADDVGLAFGPYLPRVDASLMVSRELTEWFTGFSPDGRPTVDRLPESERSAPVHALLGRRGYFTDANGCVARAAWEAVPFRSVPYAEDHVLAHDMLRAGFAKAYVPHAPVLHSHDYGLLEWVRRSFDEARAMADVYGFRELGEPRRLARWIYGSVGADLRFAAARGRPARAAVLPQSVAHHAARAAGTALGARAERLPARVVRRLSLERRAI